MREFAQKESWCVRAGLGLLTDFLDQSIACLSDTFEADFEIFVRTAIGIINIKRTLPAKLPQQKHLVPFPGVKPEKPIFLRYLHHQNEIRFLDQIWGKGSCGMALQ